MPSLFHLFREKELPDGFSIVAFDRLDLDDAATAPPWRRPSERVGRRRL